ncbi:hypothetical protein ES703_38118 [subsurface metagenome]
MSNEGGKQFPLSFCRFKKMPKELKIILRETPTGRESTPWLEPQRDKFAEAAKECKEAFKDSELRGAAKIRAMNSFMSRRLKAPGQGSP